MDWLQIVVLAVVQGFTEFLPISSSAHLILVPQLLGWADQGLAFDVAVHVGTLSAVLIYFRGHLLPMVRDWGLSVAGRGLTGESRLAWAVIFATLPVVLGGLLLADQVETTLRSPLVIAVATIGFAVPLWWADRRGRQVRDEYSITWRDVLIIGLAQALALIPGTSRSGITMTAALLTGLTRQAAARFSFLLSIPTILGAGLLKTRDLVEQALPVDWFALGAGALLSGVTAYACIFYFLKLIDRIGMFPFVVYRFLLGGLLLALFM